MKEPVQLKSDYIFQACEKAGVTVRKCKKGEEGIYINGKKVDIEEILKCCFEPETEEQRRSQ